MEPENNQTKEPDRLMHKALKKDGLVGVADQRHDPGHGGTG